MNCTQELLNLRLIVSRNRARLLNIEINGWLLYRYTCFKYNYMPQDSPRPTADYGACIRVTMQNPLEMGSTILETKRTHDNNVSFFMYLLAG